MKLYFGGTEVSGWRTLLAEENVEYVSLSYVGLRRRSKLTRPFLLSEKYPDFQKVFLDSGAYTYNSAVQDSEKMLSVAQLKDMATAYMAFTLTNIDRVEMVSEFDALALGRDWIEEQREDFWEDLGDKFLPIWHPEWGLDELSRLASKYSRVGVPKIDADGRNLAPSLNGIVQRYGTRLHGVAMTKIETMSAVNWDSVASTSWLSPSKFGDTIVWTGKELKRYPKDYKEQARKRHRTLFTSAGFDAQKIEDGDTTEVLRMTIWSWNQLVSNIQRHRGDGVVTSTPETATEPNAEIGSEVVVSTPPETRNEITTIRVREDHERQVLPILGIVTTTEMYDDPEDGVRKTREVPLVRSRSGSQRQCNSCFLSSKCPAYEPNADCAYDIPIEVKTKDQMRALLEALVEMQSQRVLFMKMAEDIEGGYADPNLSSEIDRLGKLIERKTNIEAEGFSLKIEAKGTAQAGMISRIFGQDAGRTINTYAEPIPADRMIESLDIIDAEEVVD